MGIGFLRPGIMPIGLTQGDDKSSTDIAALMPRLLADSPEDVAQGFAPRILSTRGRRTRMMWLTPTRIARHLLTRLLSLLRSPRS